MTRFLKSIRRAQVPSQSSKLLAWPCRCMVVPQSLLLRLHGTDVLGSPWLKDYQTNLTQLCLSLGTDRVESIQDIPVSSTHSSLICPAPWRAVCDGMPLAATTLSGPTEGAGGGVGTLEAMAAAGAGAAMAAVQVSQVDGKWM
jgi:hypothetical protein